MEIKQPCVTMDVSQLYVADAAGSHRFGMGEGRGKLPELWPASFVAWLHDCGMVED